MQLVVWDPGQSPHIRAVSGISFNNLALLQFFSFVGFNRKGHFCVREDITANIT